MRIIVLVSVLGLLAALTLGCTAKRGPTAAPTHQVKAINVSYDELASTQSVTRAVTLAVGDTLTVTLASNPTTGFCWTEQTQIANPAVVQQVSHHNAPAVSSMPGAAGSEVWNFAALAAGTTTITTDYNRPWPGGTKKAWTFTANITVQ